MFKSSFFGSLSSNLQVSTKNSDFALVFNYGTLKLSDLDVPLLDLFVQFVF